ncbi:hypothetical protein [Nocardioides lacusdianchii]|uniref:hypothetical protein n=1 Tax=Nocardioides lacusdianchii TaxID=2783664 RepID=UPI001CCD305F|nr:hypothetical protein [Nocardioides lacusdianchii]
MTDVTDDGSTRRRTPELPPEFAPLAPLGLASGPPSRAPGEAPRLRLTAAASRRHAPDRSATAPAGPPPAAFTAGAAPAPVPDAPVEELAPGPRRPRRLLVAGGLVGLLVVLVVVAGVALLPRSGERTVAAEVAPPAAAEELQGSEFDPPVALSPDSEYVETEVLDGDDLVVTHWISTTTPMDRVRLRPPSSPVLAGVDVAAEDLVVAADGVRLDAGAVVVDVPSDLPSAATLYVRYRLPDALRRNSSVDDRALATVTSVGVGLEGRSLPRTQVFPGGRVMTLACLAQGSRAVPESCGTYVEGAWQVRSAAGEVPVTVIAQFDLAVTR